MFENTRKVDAVLCIACKAKWANFSVLSEDDYKVGLKSKMMGQVNLVRIGQHYVYQKGAITPDHRNPGRWYSRKSHKCRVG